MIYKNFRGLNISRLGLGTMRLPTMSDEKKSIDRIKAQEIVNYVLSNGVNYIDTAFLYHNGESEKFLGEALKEYPRESYFLADKMPGFVLRPGQTPADILEEQFKRTQTDYFDFYLLHNVSEARLSSYMDNELGIIPYLLEQKKAGRFRYFGFSSHGRTETIKYFIEYWNCFDFVQLQLNYLDWTLQDAKAQYEAATEYGLPVWVMEPCRGGRLASLNPKADKMLKKARPDKSVASWAYRYLQSLPNVQVVLSGITKMEQAVDNIATFTQTDPLSADEMKVLEQAIILLKEELNVPCTKCRYCDGCPKGLDIPELLGRYNELCVDRTNVLVAAINLIPEERKPASCIACGQCASKCPQNIDIPGVMRTFTQLLARGR